MITSYHKTQWQVGIRLIAQFLPTAVGDLLMHYLIYMPPFLCFLCNQMKLESAQGYLFTKEGSQPWNAQEI